MLYTLLALAIAPGIAIILFIYLKDKYEKEPFSMVIKCFLFGLFTIFLPLLIETIASNLYPDFHFKPFAIFIYAFFIVGLSEEFSKYLLLRFYAYKSPLFNEPFDGIVYSVVISMAFATVENIFYVLEHGIGVALIRMFTAIPAHAACAVLMGYYVGIAKFSKNKIWYLILGLSSAVISHGFYDWFLFQYYMPGLQLLAFVVLIIIVILSFKAIKRHKNNSPFNVSNPPLS